MASVSGRGDGVGRNKSFNLARLDSLVSLDSGRISPIQSPDKIDNAQSEPKQPDNHDENIQEESQSKNKKLVASFLSCAALFPWRINNYSANTLMAT